MRLRSLLLLCLTLLAVDACKKPAPQEESDPQAAAPSAVPVATTPAPVIILLDAAPPSSSSMGVVALVTKWNMAYGKRDAQELLPLYAPKVIANGATVAAADHVKKKLAADVDLKQSFSDVTTETTADGKDTYAHFAKRMTDDQGQTKEYPMLLIVRDGVIVEESDDPPDWCINKDKTTNAKTQPGFKLSAPAAVAAAKDSKHFAELRKRIPRLGTDLFGFGCAKRCAVPRRECGYHFRMSDMEDSTKIIEWVYVDPVNKVLWWQEKDWMSEQLR